MERWCGTSRCAGVFILTLIMSYVESVVVACLLLLITYLLTFVFSSVSMSGRVCVPFSLVNGNQNCLKNNHAFLLVQGQ